MKRLSLVCLICSVLLLSGCSDVASANDGEVTLENPRSDYILSEYEEDFSTILGFEDTLPSVSDKYLIEAYVIDTSVVMYEDGYGNNHWTYTVTMKGIGDSMGFVINSEDLYWKYTGQVTDDTVDVEVYISEEDVEFIVVDGMYLFEDCFDAYIYE